MTAIEISRLSTCANADKLLIAPILLSHCMVAASGPVSTQPLEGIDHCASIVGVMQE